MLGNSMASRLIGTMLDHTVKIKNSFTARLLIE